MLILLRESDPGADSELATASRQTVNGSKRTEPERDGTRMCYWERLIRYVYPRIGVMRLPAARTPSSSGRF